MSTQTIRGTRWQIQAWLDDRKPDEWDLLQYINRLKKERQFFGTFKDAFRLLRDLRNGRTAVLFELFPWVKEQLIKSESQAKVVEEYQRTTRPLPSQAEPPPELELKQAVVDGAACTGNFLASMAAISAKDDDTKPAPRVKPSKPKPNGKTLANFKPLAAPDFDELAEVGF